MKLLPCRGANDPSATATSRGIWHNRYPTYPVRLRRPICYGLFSMIKAQRFRIPGVPYPHTKVTGNVEGGKKWTATIVEKTAKFPKINGPCLVRVTFKLSRDKFHDGSPFGTDLDNLLKRFLDALGQTVFSDAPGKDACVVAIEAAKVLVLNPQESGVDGEIIEMQTASDMINQVKKAKSSTP